VELVDLINFPDTPPGPAGPIKQQITLPSKVSTNLNGRVRTQFTSIQTTARHQSISSHEQTDGGLQEATPAMITAGTYGEDNTTQTNSSGRSQ
jgi:hypothetical protein